MSDILPLKAKTLTRLSSAGIVGAWMLFPDDHIARRRAVAHVTSLELVDAFAAGAFPSTKVPQLVKTALDAYSEEDMRAHWEELSPRGYGAGLQVYNSCLRIVRGERSPVVRTTQEIGKAVFGHSMTSRHVNDAVWRKYRPVAAMWAAFVYLHDDESRELMDFPCAPGFLPNFLSLAEHFRQLAETTVPPRRSEPLIGPGVSVALPDEVSAALPRTHFQVRA